MEDRTVYTCTNAYRLHMYTDRDKVAEDNDHGHDEVAEDNDHGHDYKVMMM